MGEKIEVQREGKRRWGDRVENGTRRHAQMRKKQARPAKRILPRDYYIGINDEEDPTADLRDLSSPSELTFAENSRKIQEFALAGNIDKFSRTWQYSPSLLSPSSDDYPHRTIAFPCSSQDASPALKIPKCELEDESCYDYSQLPRICLSGSPDTRDYCLPVVSPSVSSYTFPTATPYYELITNKDSANSSTSNESESPLKRLERCVKASSHIECSVPHTSTKLDVSLPSSVCSPTATRSPRTHSAAINSDRAKSSADALGELSQLVHRIGTVRLPVCEAPNKRAPNSVTSNIFTCLKCAHRFDTLDELVLHISATKHFTRRSTRNADAIAPWESDRPTSNFGKQLSSPDFLATLFCAQKCLKIQCDLAKSDKNGSS
ncbi:unnamed protein product [Thelazia callipaeda]|uniref:C2H2-type domain-containing protein n=1 Tax=Thelazia callipaeda TaxID=103827 RepID=A0A0N5CZM3_THECL|nr:unnamed protein product [Thelazia callipaeda]